jgi:hypothetical protein
MEGSSKGIGIKCYAAFGVFLHQVVHEVEDRLAVDVLQRHVSKKAFYDHVSKDSLKDVECVSLDFPLSGILFRSL